MVKINKKQHITKTGIVKNNPKKVRIDVHLTTIEKFAKMFKLEKQIVSDFDWMFKTNEWVENSEQYDSKLDFIEFSPDRDEGMQPIFKKYLDKMPIRYKIKDRNPNGEYDGYDLTIVGTKQFLSKYFDIK